MKSQGYVLLAIILTILISIFTVINTDRVEVNFLFGSTSSPLILIILFSVLMGGVITAISGMLKIFQLKKEIKKLQKENEEIREQFKKRYDTTNELSAESTVNDDLKSDSKNE